MVQLILSCVRTTTYSKIIFRYTAIGGISSVAADSQKTSQIWRKQKNLAALYGRQASLLLPALQCYYHVLLKFRGIQNNSLLILSISAETAS